MVTKQHYKNLHMDLMKKSLKWQENETLRWTTLKKKPIATDFTPTVLDIIEKAWILN